MGNEQSVQDGGRLLGALGQAVGNQIAQHDQEAGRIVSTIFGSLDVLSGIVTQPDQHQRLLELIKKCDFVGLLSALASPGGATFEPDFLPKWIRKCGGYFPKFAQVLSYRADLIRNPEVLAGLAHCLEDMPTREISEVQGHVRSLGWSEDSVSAVGDSLAAGSVAQVNLFTLPDGTPAVMKVAWPDTKAKMATDFRLFAHATKILKALQLEGEKAEIIGAMFDAVQKSEPSVMAEFDLQKEAAVIAEVTSLCELEWPAAYRSWQMAMAPVIQTSIPEHLRHVAIAGFAQSLGWRIRFPRPLSGYCAPSVICMSFAGGQSLHQLLQGAAGQQGESEAAVVLIAYATPFIGWLLLCKSSSCVAHVDPHPGNFKWDASEQALWVLDWGSHVKLTEATRRNLCTLVTLIADDAEYQPIAQAARAMGISGSDDQQLANIVKGLFNASSSEAAPDVLNRGAIERLLRKINEEVAPVIRCLGILGGMLRTMQEKLQDNYQTHAPLSLARLWAPFARAN